jgi:hypothetical protein
VDVKVDMATCRVILDDPAALAAGAVTIHTAGGQSPKPADSQKLAIDIFPEVRKLVVGFIPNTQGRNSGTQALEVSLSALP